MNWEFQRLRAAAARKIGFGTWSLADQHWSPVTPGSAKATISRAYELGIRHFDTAESYGNGRAEQLLGQALKTALRTNRQGIQIATKSVVRPPASLQKHLERSLRRLNCQYIDLYYIHWPRQGIDLTDALRSLETLKHHGTIGALGVCNINRATYDHIASRIPLDCVQFGYNLIWRAPERDRLPEIPIERVAYSPLGQGLLSHPFKESPTWHERDHRRSTPLFQPSTWSAVQPFNQRYHRLCHDHNLFPGAVALEWLTRRSCAAVTGARNTHQITTLLTGLEALALRTDLDPLFTALDTLSNALQPHLPTHPNLFNYTPTPRRPPST